MILNVCQQPCEYVSAIRVCVSKDIRMCQQLHQYVSATLECVSAKVHHTSTVTHSTHPCMSRTRAGLPQNSRLYVHICSTATYLNLSFCEQPNFANSNIRTYIYTCLSRTRAVLPHDSRVYGHVCSRHISRLECVSVI